MRIFALLSYLLILPGFAFADYQQVVPETSFDLLTLSNPGGDELYYGELSHFPHTYQFLVTETMAFLAQVAVPPDGNQETSLIVIKEERRGVSEVGRRTGKTETWEVSTDSVSRLDFVRSTPLVATLEPGVYRLEVSSPDNTGKYLLQINQQPELSYFEEVSVIFKLHSFFGSGFLGTLVVPAVWIPLVVLLLIGCLWYWRKQKSHA